MERDYAETLSRLRGIREQLIDPRISAYGGHVVKTAGDGMLVEFGSADAAFEALGSKRGDIARRVCTVGTRLAEGPTSGLVLLLETGP